MDMLVVQGGRPLSGRIRVDGSKNAALPLMAASLMTQAPIQLQQVPDLVDVRTMIQLLRNLGVQVTLQQDICQLDARQASGGVANYDLVRRMRASVCVLGPLLARFGTAQVSLPGGCNIGHRPIDLHLKGLAALGADLRISRGYVVANANQLLGTDISLAGPNGSSVTATCNIMAAATAAEGTTIIHSAAQEPEVVCLGRFLNHLGAQIQGLGSSTLEIRGPVELSGGDFTIPPDRIEAATLAIAAAITGGQIEIENAPVNELTAVVQLLQEVGTSLQTSASQLTVCGQQPIRATDLVTAPYPGIPTDTQAQFMALLCVAEGTSMVTDRVFPDRFMHASELVRMGADIHRAGDSAVVRGVPRLSAAPLMASDLRASAALLLAAIAADGESQLRRIYHLDRGYVRLEEKLNRLGAEVTRCKDNQQAT